MAVPAPVVPPWLAALTFEALARRLVPNAIEAALAHGLVYARPPSMNHEGVIEAVVTEQEATAAEGPARPPVLHTVRLRSYHPSGERIFHECTCNRWGYCPHVPAILIDLALSPGLRDAVVRGEPLDTCLSALPGLREEARRQHVAGQIVSQWLPVAPLASVVTPEYHLSLVTGEGGGGLQSSAVGVDGAASFVLRLRLPGERALLDPASLLGLGLRAEDRHVLSLCAPVGGARKGFRAAGTNASLVLRLLRDRVVRLEGRAEPLAFSSSPVTLDIAFAHLPRSVLAMAVRPPDDGVRELYGVTGGRWTDAEGLGVPVPCLEGRWRTEDGVSEVSCRDTVLFTGPFPWLWVPGARAFHPVASSVDLEVAKHLQLNPAVELVQGHEELIYRTVRRNLRGRGLSLPSPERLGVTLPRPELVARLEGAPLDVLVRLEARYPHGVFALLADAQEAPEVFDPQRDPELESAAVARVRASGLRPDPARAGFSATGEGAVGFWTRGLSGLQGEGVPALTVLVPASLQRVRARRPVRARVNVRLEAGWLEVECALDSEGLSVELTAVREALERKRRWVVLEDGSLTELTEALSDLLEDVTDALPTGRGRLAVHQLGRVEGWVGTSGSERATEPTREAREGALEGAGRGGWPALSVPEPELPEGLLATLRPYQRAGLAWLQFLRALGAGGVLADDMGLGKTVTTLAHLLWCREREGTAPSLVVCPSSVVGNWVAECARFTPSLRILVWRGSERERRLADVARADLVVTTYALLRRDVEALAGVDFRHLVLDEAQNIKSADALTTQAARRLRARCRLALTGTPVENRLGELWSIMEFCNAGSLGTARQFEARFERPVLAGSERAAARLRALVRPFLLRRAKREVLQDLPPREDIDLSCPLGAAQRRRYDALAATLRREVEERVQREGLPRSGLVVLTALLRLRQLACDPRLVDPRVSPSASSKRAVFLDLVRDLVAEGRRALVFSQFVELLTLWRQDLDREGILYEYLDGSTQHREAVVARFQQGTAPLFLISLRAGGTGLNLAEADTVILCDPWWNPAVEDQAADRAHRLGQTRAVTVYRLVARGTVEDRVAVMKARKRELADAVIREDEGALRGLTEDDVRALLEDAEPDEVSDDQDPSQPPPPRVGDASDERITGPALDEVRLMARSWLKRQGALQKTLAERVGLSQSAVSLLLTGKLGHLPAAVATRIRMLAARS